MRHYANKCRKGTLLTSRPCCKRQMPMNLKPYISAGVIVATVPALGFLLWSTVLWPSAVLEILSGNYSGFGWVLAISVPSGWIGITGLFVTGLSLVADESIVPLRYLVMLSIGILAGIASGLVFFFNVWWLSWVIILPIAVSIHLLWLARSRAKSLSVKFEPRHARDCGATG